MVAQERYNFHLFAIIRGSFYFCIFLGNERITFLLLLQLFFIIAFDNGIVIFYNFNNDQLNAEVTLRLGKSLLRVTY